MSAFGKFGLKPGLARIALDSVPDGYEAFALARLADEIGGNGPVVHVMRDGQRLNDFQQLLKFVAPDLPVLTFPGWIACRMTGCRRARMLLQSGFRR